MPIKGTKLYRLPDGRYRFYLPENAPSGAQIQKRMKKHSAKRFINLGKKIYISPEGRRKFCNPGEEPIGYVKMETRKKYPNPNPSSKFKSRAYILPDHTKKFYMPGCEPEGAIPLKGERKFMLYKMNDGSRKYYENPPPDGTLVIRYSQRYIYNMQLNQIIYHKRPIKPIQKSLEQPSKKRKISFDDHSDDQSVWDSLDPKFRPISQNPGIKIQ